MRFRPRCRMANFVLRGARILRSCRSSLALQHKATPSPTILGHTWRVNDSAVRRSGDLRCFAKKSSKKKQKTSQIAPPVKTAEPWAEVDVVMWLLLLIESYKRQTGKTLLEDAEISSIATEIFEAPFCLLIHDYFEVEETRFVYANKSALEMMEATWEDFVGTPSSFFEKPVLEQAASEGHLQGLSTKVESSTGTQKEIQEAELVNITSPSEENVGQMIVFDQWILEDGTVAGPGHVAEEDAPTEEDLIQMKTQVEQLAARIRDLKETQGFTNKDEIVQREVEQLLTAKEKLKELEETRSQWLQQNEDTLKQE